MALERKPFTQAIDSSVVNCLSEGFFLFPMWVMISVACYLRTRIGILVRQNTSVGEKWYCYGLEMPNTKFLRTGQKNYKNKIMNPFTILSSVRTVHSIFKMI